MTRRLFAHLPAVILLGAAGFAFAGLMASPAAAGVATDLDASVFQSASAQVNGGTVVVDAKSSIGSAPLHDLSVSVFAPASGGFADQVTGIAHSTIAAHWDSADSGTVDVTNRGWTVLSPQDDHNDIAKVALNTAASGVADWSYEFSVSRDSDFVLSSTITGGAGFDLGLGDWNLAFSEDGGVEHVLTLHQFLTAGQSDGFESFLSLAAGHTYRVSLLSDESADFEGTFPLTAAETDHFAWFIARDPGEVPEPATWALAILGFGFAGAALRRRGTAFA
jgi:hypothetical protein